MGLYEVPKKDIVWVKTGQPKKHTPADAKESGYHLSAVLDDRDAHDDSEYGYFVGVFGETKHGWFSLPCKSWKTKRTPVSYNNSTKVIKFMGFNGKYYSFKLKPAAFTKAKKIIDSYNKKWDVKELAKKKTPAKKPATRKRKTPAKKAPVYKGKRPSPSISATAVKAGTKRRGGSGKMYVAKSYKINGKKVQRWVQA